MAPVSTSSARCARCSGSSSAWNSSSASAHASRLRRAAPDSAGELSEGSGRVAGAADSTGSHADPGLVIEAAPGAGAEAASTGSLSTRTDGSARAALRSVRCSRGSRSRRHVRSALRAGDHCRSRCAGSDPLPILRQKAGPMDRCCRLFAASQTLETPCKIEHRTRVRLPAPPPHLSVFSASFSTGFAAGSTWIHIAGESRPPVPRQACSCLLQATELGGAPGGLRSQRSCSTSRRLFHALALPTIACS